MLTNIITNLDKIIAEVQKVTPHNIREGVEIFGVEGSLQEILTQHKHVSPKVFSQLVVPDVEYNALHEVIIDGVTNDIDSNIISNNIRYGKRILGIQGVLSELTEQEYQDMLLLEIEILGYNIYVHLSNLHLNEGEYNYEDGKLIANECTVDGTKLIIN